MMTAYVQLWWCFFCFVTFHIDAIDGSSSSSLVRTACVVGDEIGERIGELCFTFHSVPLNFKQAKETCAKEGGSLPVLDSRSSNTDFLALMSSNHWTSDMSRVWLGITTYLTDWTWSLDGTIVKYQGCFPDSSNNADVLGNQTLAQLDQVLSENCIQYCLVSGFAYTAVTRGTKCFCGNSYSKYLPRTYLCLDRCAADKRYFCGGESASAIWYNDGAYVNWVNGSPLDSGNCGCYSKDPLDNPWDGFAACNCYNKKQYVCSLPLDKCEGNMYGFLTISEACYFRSNNVETWFSARYQCHLLGGDLARIPSLDVQKAVTVPLLWIGLTNRQWEWLNGEKMIYSNFTVELPGTEEEDAVHVRNHMLEQCVTLDMERKEWLVELCSEERAYFCQTAIKSEADPINFNLEPDELPSGCTYGDKPRCIFPCSCQNSHEVCDEKTGACASGCKDGYPVGEGFRWSGPGCRIGSVAYAKTASAMSGQKNPDDPIDGDADSCYISSQTSSTDTEYWWKVDLGATYIIFNVSLYNTKFVINGFIVSERLQDARVYVTNSNDITNDNNKLCGVVFGHTAGSASIVCMRPLLGRYVSVVNSQKHPEHHSFWLCEVVVIGALAADCSLCGDSQCDALNGCRSFCKETGKRLPTCTESVCSIIECHKGECDSFTGSCMCNDGYFGKACETAIVFTSVSIDLIEPFRLEYMDLDNVITMEVLNEIKGMLTQALKGILDGFQSLDVVFLSKKSEIETVAYVEIITHEDALEFDAIALQKKLYLLLDPQIDAYKHVKRVTVGLPQIATKDMSKLKDKNKYVYTPSSFLIEENFQWNYLDLNHADSQHLIKNVEASLNKALVKTSIDQFQSVYVTLLRKVKSIIGVDIIIVTLSSDGYPIGEVQKLIQAAMQKVLSKGVLGDYFVDYTGPKDVQVSEAFLGNRPAVGALSYVFTHGIIRLKTMFQLSFIHVNRVEMRRLTIMIKTELNNQLEKAMKKFQFVEIAVARPRSDGTTSIEFDVVSLSTVADFDPNAISETVDAAVKDAVASGLMGQDIDTSSPDVYSVDQTTIDKLPAKQYYAVTKVSIKLDVEFIMEFTNDVSDETLSMKKIVGKELWQELEKGDLWMQFTDVLLIRGDKKDTEIDIFVGHLTTKESFDAKSAQQAIIASLQPALKDGDLGGYTVHSKDPNVLIVDLPLLDEVPKLQEYAFIRGSLDMEEPWIEEFNDWELPQTKAIVFAVEKELNYEFDDDGRNRQMEVDGLRPNHGNVSLNINVASLEDTEDFNATEVQNMVIHVIEVVLEDGDIGGYHANPRVVEALELYEVELGSQQPAPDASDIDVVRDNGITDAQKAPGLQWYIIVIICVSAVCFTALMVALMYYAVGPKGSASKGTAAKDDASTGTGTTSAAKNET